MKATLTIQTRLRGGWIAKPLIRLASVLQSVRLARFALTLVHFEMRVEKGRWEEIPHGLKAETSR